MTPANERRLVTALAFAMAAVGLAVALAVLSRWLGAAKVGIWLRWLASFVTPEGVEALWQWWQGQSP